MKSKLIPLLGVMVVVALVGAIIISLMEQQNKGLPGQEEPKIRVAASFYPAYIIGINITDQIQGVQVESLTDLNVGCLHDYQLTTGDMRLLSGADVLLINGGGMESYLSEVVKNYPELTIIDISEGIPMIGSMEPEGEPNPHVWLDPERYMSQITNVREGLSAYVDGKAGLSKEYKEEVIKLISSNSDTYLQQVSVIEDDFKELIDNIADSRSDRLGISQAANAPQDLNNSQATNASLVIDDHTQAVNDSQNIIKEKVIIFHEAFAYIADRAGLEVAYTVELEGDTALSAGEIAEVIRLVDAENIKYLFTEKQYGDSITDRIEEETDADAFVIDSAVTGDGSKESYLDAMEYNLLILRNALLN